MARQHTAPAVAGHGTPRLPAVNVEDYNVELKDDEGFIGDDLPLSFSSTRS